MVIRKIQNMWDRGSSAAMSPKFWFAYHQVLVFWALAALIGLALAAPLGGRCRSASRSSGSRSSAACCWPSRGARCR